MMSITLKMQTSLVLDSSPVLARDISLKRAILETLAYSDVFNFPLNGAEIQRYLPIRATVDDVANCLVQTTDRIASSHGYYFLTGRKDLVDIREERARFSTPVFRRAIFYGRILAILPFIRMVGITGSLAVHNANEKADLDYMLVAASGRVWTARLFALLLGKFTARFGHTLCPNLILAEHALEWQKQDLYAARELCQMVPVAGLDIYARLRRVNDWTESFLPNAKDAPYAELSSLIRRSAGQWMLEQPLSGALGDRLDAWEMKRKIERFKHQKDFGPETVFSADICQGNFDHHGLQTREAFRDRLAWLGLDDRFING
jgi:hypothetical protein